MDKFSRFSVAFIVFVTVYLLVNIFIIGNIWPYSKDNIRYISSLIISFVFAYFFYSKVLGNKSKELLKYVLLGGLITGGICFALGFFLPLIFYPSANQGPLLGILFT